jgi:hypothetical protein
MRTALAIISSILLASLPTRAQAPAFEDPLLDRVVGKWVLQGTIDAKKTTHDVVAEWVLGHQYVQLHEISREKDPTGAPAYEATVFIGWDKRTGDYACLWLDSTGGGGLAPTVVGHAKRNGDRMAFLFTVPDGTTFHTTFAYTRTADTWQWLMDGEEGGKLQPFARLTLTRKQVGG